jgi:hypothetical protein
MSQPTEVTEIVLGHAESEVESEVESENESDVELDVESDAQHNLHSNEHSDVQSNAHSDKHASIPTSNPTIKEDLMVNNSSIYRIYPSNIESVKYIKSTIVIEKSNHQAHEKRSYVVKIYPSYRILLKNKQEIFFGYETGSILKYPVIILPLIRSYSLRKTKNNNYVDTWISPRIHSLINDFYEPFLKDCESIQIENIGMLKNIMKNYSFLFQNSNTRMNCRLKTTFDNPSSYEYIELLFNGLVAHVSESNDHYGLKFLSKLSINRLSDIGFNKGKTPHDQSPEKKKNQENKKSETMGNHQDKKFTLDEIKKKEWVHKYKTHQVLQIEI